MKHRFRADGTVLFEAIPPPKDALKYYGFSQFTCGLNDLSPDEKAFLPPTDSRLRPDVRALELGDAAKALAYKTALEKAQRSRSEQKHKRLWFEQKQDAMTYTTMWVSNNIIGEKIAYDWVDFKNPSDLDDMCESYSFELIKCRLSLSVSISVIHSKKFVGTAKPCTRFSIKIYLHLKVVLVLNNKRKNPVEQNSGVTYGIHRHS
uniref:Uncharacterized protein n=1 Tax=Parascaris equorum TaxID=6256 RepID=A0A914S656_PAREQ